MIPSLAGAQRVFREHLRTGSTNLIAAAVGTAGGILLARELGPTERGFAAAAILWPTFVGSVFSAGLPQAMTFWLAAEEGEQRRILASTGAALGLALGAVCAGVGWVAAPFISSNPDVLFGLRVMFLLAPVSIAGGVLTGGLQALDLRRWNVARLVQPTCYLGLLGAGAVLSQLSTRLVVATLAASIALQGAIVLVLVHRCLGRPGRATLASARRLLHYGSRALLGGAPWILNSRLDQLLLSVTLPAAALGNYVVAVSLSQLVLPLTTAFGSVAFPRLAGASSEGERRAVERTAVLGALVTAAAVLIPIVILSPVVIPRLFGPGYEPAVRALYFLAPGAGAYALNYVLEDLLRGWGRPLAVAASEAVGVVVTAALLLVLARRFGINGAASASSIAYLVVTLVLIHLLRRTRETT